MTPLCCESFNTNVPANFAGGPCLEPEKKIDQLNVAGGIANARTQTEIPKMKSPSEACSRSRSADISVTTPLLWALLLRTSSLPSVLPNLGVPIFRLPPRCSGLCCSGASFAVRAPDLGVPTSQVHPVALGFAALWPALPVGRSPVGRSPVGGSPKMAEALCRRCPGDLSTGDGLRSWAKPVDRNPALLAEVL